MVRPSALVAVFLTLAPATVHAFDHHHDHHHSSHHYSGGSGDGVGGGGCGGDDSAIDDAPSGGGGVTVSPPTPAPAPITRRVFVTTSVHDGALGGIVGADAICQQAATAHGFEGVYRAWLSDGRTAAAERVLANGPWLTATGAIAFATRADLTSAPRVPIVDEDGQPAHDVWSGSDTRGRANGMDCQDWTSAKSFEEATTGSDATADATWGGGGVLQPCSSERAVLCIAQ